MMALTATASPRVREDILKQLGLKNHTMFIQSFNRPNLKYEIRTKAAKAALQEIIDTIRNDFSNQSGIVYCLSQKDCDNVAEQFRSAGINAIPYHAGLGDVLRAETQSRWTKNKVKVVCATIAFGMYFRKRTGLIIFRLTEGPQNEPTLRNTSNYSVLLEQKLQRV